jgi:tetratricopeptide (TPR) repeat protein
MDHIREEIGGGTGWHRLGNMMIRLGEYKKAEEVYETLLHSTQSDNQSEIAHLYHQLGFIQKEKGDLNTAQIYFQKTLKLQKQYLSLHDPALAITYHRIGSIHFAMNECETALSFYQKALNIQKRSLPAYHPDIAVTYSYIGDVYMSAEDYSAALSFYQMTLETQAKALPSNDPSLAVTYNCMGLVRKHIKPPPE